MTLSRRDRSAVRASTSPLALLAGARGGMRARWRLASATGILALGLGGFAQPVLAQSVYTIGSDPTISDASTIGGARQSNTAPDAGGGVSLDFEAIVTTGTVTNTETAGGSLVTSVTGSNTVSATVDGNVATYSGDVNLASGTGTTSDMVLFGAQENLPDTGADDTIGVSAELSGIDITSTVTQPGDGSSVSLSGNTISADADLNQLTQTLQGQINPAFANTDTAGVTGITAAVGASTTAITTDLEAGLLVGSVQVNDQVGGDTTNDSVDAFAVVTGDSDIAVTVGGAYGTGLSVIAESNTISADFTGNNADNLLDLQAGGGTTLASSAGIANVQINDTVAAGTSARIDTAAAQITATVDDTANTAPFTSSTLSLSSNSITANATGSLAENDLAIAAGIDVNGANDDTQANEAGSTSQAQASLFVVNRQVSEASDFTAVIDGDGVDEIAATVNEGLSASTLRVDDSTIATTALANDASSSITVAGASSFAANVAASNTQLIDSDGAAGDTISATTTEGTINVAAGQNAGDDITGSTISSDDNAITSLAVANRDPLTISITASTISDETTANTTTTAGSTAVASGAGISAVSLQRIAGVDDTTPTAVTATTDAGALATTIGNASTISGSTVTQAGNDITATANANEQVIGVTLDAANSIAASSAIGARQEAVSVDVGATTSSASITTVLVASEAGGGATGVTAVIGDADLADGIADGNVVASSAAGQINSATLAVSAGTSVTGTGAATDTLRLDATTNLTSSAASETTLLADQRLTDGDITATTSAPTLSLATAPGAQTVTGSTLAVDGNRVTASARGNTATSALSFDAASVSMTTDGAGLASLGVAQDIEITGTDDIAATVQGGAGTEIQNAITGNGTVSNTTLSADANTVSAFAAGNTATSQAALSGSTLSTETTGITTASLAPVTAATDSDIELLAATVTTGVLQSNAAAVTAGIGTTAGFEIAADLETEDDITGVTLSADTNTVLAQARGASAATTTTLAYSTIESSAAQAVSQDQAGAVTASLGDVTGAGTGTGGATISVTAAGVDSDLSGSTLSANANTLGAELFGATSTSVLSATATGALESGSAAGGTSTLTPATNTPGEFVVSSQAEFISATRQSVSGAITGETYDASVAVTTDDIGGGTVTADGNLLTAQATGGRAASTLTLSAADLGAANTDAAAAALLTDQALSGALDADISASDVIVTVADLGTEATGTNGSETVSASANTLSALGTGLSGANTLTATAAAGQGGALAGSATIDVDGNNNDLLATATADQVLISNQDLAATADLGVEAATTVVRVNQTGAAVNGDTLSVESNTILAQGTGATNANRLTSTSGTTSTASSLLVANQETAGALDVDVTTATLDLNAAGTVDASTLTLSSNAIRSTAASLANANTLTVDAGGAITGAAAGTGDLASAANTSLSLQGAYDAGILSNQMIGDVTADVTSDVTAPTVSLTVTGAVGTTAGATLLADANTVSASAAGASDTNALTLSSDNALTTVTAGILQKQDSVGAVTAGVTGTEGSNLVELTAGATVASSTLSASNNSLSASASNLTAANTLAADAGTAATATAGSATNTLTTANRGTANIISDTVGDRMIASDQVVSGDGDVTAEIDTDPTVTITAAGLVSDNSAVTLDRNAMSATATVASVSNTLSDDAGTALATGAGIASIQESAADATAALDDGDLAIALGGGVTDGAVSLGSNALTATARGLQATNALTSTASSIDGDATEAFSTTLASNEATLANTAMAQLSSVQQQTGAVSATVGEDVTPEFENSALTVAVTGVVTDSSVGLDANAVTAQATGVSGTNTLGQTATGAIADGSAANLASVQEIGTAGGSDATEARVIGLTMETSVTSTVDGSTLTVDDNAVLATATAGSGSNALSVSAGTSATGGGTLTLVNDAGDATAATLVQSADGDAILGSTQVSASAVTAAVVPGTDGTNPDEFPRASLDIDGAVGGTTASTLTVDGNSFRALATNLTASNTLAVEADTAIATYGAGLASLQDVNEATTGTVSGAQATLDAAAAFTGTGSVSETLIVAAGTGGAATNSLSLQAADLSDGGAAAAVSADLQGGGAGTAPITASGADLASGLSSIQTRTGAVTAQITDGRTGDAAGTLGASASVTDALTGTMSVDANVLLAQARGLQATNSLAATLENTLTNASLNLSSLQEAESGTVTAAINAGSTAGTDDALIGLTAGAAVTGTASLDGNVAQAMAMTNLATNTLAVRADGSINVGTGTTATIGGDQDLDATTVGVSVMNGQLASAGTAVTIDNLDIETTITGALIGTATVDGNRVIGDARNNFASNALTLTAENDLTASAALLNSQQADAGADVSTVINGAAGTDAGRIFLTASDAVTGTASVSGNMVQGNAVSNQAFNSMVLNAATLAQAGGGSVGAGTGTADFVALNAQTNAADATTTITDYAIGLAATAAGAFSGTAEVENNMVLASAAGNFASNSFTIDAAGNNRADFVFTGNQSNTGAISARITSATISAAAGNASAAGTFNVAGNSIGATAQGNVSTTRVGGIGSSFSNF